MEDDRAEAAVGPDGADVAGLEQAGRAAGDPCRAERARDVDQARHVLADRELAGAHASGCCRLPPTVTVDVVVIEPEHVVERAQVAGGRRRRPRGCGCRRGASALSPTSSGPIDAAESVIPSGSVPPIVALPRAKSRPGQPARPGRFRLMSRFSPITRVVDLLGGDADPDVDRAADGERLGSRRVERRIAQSDP